MFKRLAIFLFSLVFLAGCATQADLKKLEDKFQKQSRTDLLKTLESTAGTKMYGRTSISGGSSDVDDITAMANGDLCFVVDSNGIVYIYKYNSSSTATEVEPFIVTPTSGTGRWILSKGISFTTGSARPRSP